MAPGVLVQMRVGLATVLALWQSKNMIDEPRIERIDDSDLQPATKGDLNTLKAEIKRELEETRRHFDVVAENIHLDVASANQDELSYLKDQKIPDHEQRLQRLEKEAGLPVGAT